MTREEAAKELEQAWLAGEISYISMQEQLKELGYE